LHPSILFATVLQLSWPHKFDIFVHFLQFLINLHICKTFVIPYQYPTLILVWSDLTFTVSDPKKMVGHKIGMHHSKFRPNKNQCRRRKIPQHPILDRMNSYVHRARTSTFHSILPWKCTILISDTE
jgi:hypothetical protein